MYYTFFIDSRKRVLSNGDNDTFGSQGREHLFYFYKPFLRHPKDTHREYSVKPLFI